MLIERSNHVTRNAPFWILLAIFFSGFGSLFMSLMANQPIMKQFWFLYHTINIFSYIFITIGFLRINRRTRRKKVFFYLFNRLQFANCRLLLFHHPVNPFPSTCVLAIENPNSNRYEKNPLPIPLCFRLLSGQGTELQFHCNKQCNRCLYFRTKPTVSCPLVSLFMELWRRYIVHCKQSDTYLWSRYLYCML